MMRSANDRDGYQPMTLAALAPLLAGVTDEPTRFRLVLEFLEEFQWEKPGDRLGLLEEEPGPTQDRRWDVLLAGLAEHLAAQDGQAGPAWADQRALETFWFLDNTPGGRADALVRAPAALRRRGVFISADDLARV